MRLSFPWHILFPKRCPFCGTVIPHTARCCASCAPNLLLLSQNARLIGELPRQIAAYAPFSYEGLAEQAVWRLKFYGVPAVARHLAPYLAEALPDGAEFDLVVPIPMTRRKERRRGYNQAALLARFTAEALGLPVRPLLQKRRETAEQHTLSARERKTNLSGAYRLTDPAAVRGKRILLCDDVVTTGATLREAAMLLYDAGAESVSAAAAAFAGGFPRETQSERSKPCPPQNASTTPSARRS